MTDVSVALIGYTITKNAYKQEVKTETKTTIFAQKDGIKRAEFYSAGNAGLRAEFVLKVAQIDYNNELELELDGQRYGIYRTYPVDQDYIELYCERKGGVQDVESN